MWRRYSPPIFGFLWNFRDGKQVGKYLRSDREINVNFNYLLVAQFKEFVTTARHFSLVNILSEYKLHKHTNWRMSSSFGITLSSNMLSLKEIGKTHRTWTFGKKIFNSCYKADPLTSIDQNHSKIPTLSYSVKLLYTTEINTDFHYSLSKQE